MAREMTEYVSAPTAQEVDPVSATSRARSRRQAAAGLEPERARPTAPPPDASPPCSCCPAGPSRPQRREPRPAGRASPPRSGREASGPCGLGGRPRRRRRTATTWLSLISAASDKDIRWFIPPPQRTAYFSRARSPGVVLRVSAHLGAGAAGARPRRPCASPRGEMAQQVERGALAGQQGRVGPVTVISTSPTRATAGAVRGTTLDARSAPPWREHRLGDRRGRPPRRHAGDELPTAVAPRGRRGGRGDIDAAGEVLRERGVDHAPPRRVEAADVELRGVVTVAATGRQRTALLHGARRVEVPQPRVVALGGVLAPVAAPVSSRSRRRRRSRWPPSAGSRLPGLRGAGAPPTRVAAISGQRPRGPLSEPALRSTPAVRVSR